MPDPSEPTENMWVVVVFGDKRKHSDVLGPYGQEEATLTAARLGDRDDFETIAFPVQSEQAYTSWLTGQD